MSYDILKNLGLDALDANSPAFLKALEQMQKDAWRSLHDDAAVVSRANGEVRQPPVQAGDEEIHWTDDDILAAADAAPWPDIPAWDF